jgi:hypothetical protein
VASEGLSLFDEFELKGYWWIPENPKRQLYGNLSFDRESGFSLELMGMIREAGGIAEEEAIIQGFTTKGKNVTLLDSYTTSMQVHMPGIPVNELSCHYLFLGDVEFSSRQDIRFTSMIVNLTHLENWLGMIPFEMDFVVETPTGRGVSARYQPTRVNTFAVPSLEAKISISGRFDMSADRHRELKWTYVHYVEIMPEQPRPWNWFIDVIDGLSSFLTLLMWQPIYPRRVTGLGQEVEYQERDGRTAMRRDSTEIFWQFLIPQVEPSLSANAIIFRMRDIDLPSALHKWFSNRQRLGPVYSLFFGSFYTSEIHVPFQFHAMTRALEGLHRTLFGGQYHSDNDYEILKEELRQCVNRLQADNDWKNKFKDGELKYGNQYSQGKRFKNLLNDLEPALRTFLVPNAESFVRRIVDTRNYLTHLDQTSQKNALQGGDLTYGYHKLQLLLGVFLLRGTGISDGDILTALRKSVPIRNSLSLARHHAGI